MLGTRITAIARCSGGLSAGRAALLRQSAAAAATTVVRTFADVEVEHARGNWKTYGNLESYKPGNFHILTFNKISPVGLARFPSDRYDVFAGDSSGTDQHAAACKSNAHAILLRSHKLQEDQVPHTVRAIAR